MEQFQNQELEYVVDDYYDMTDFEDDDVLSRSRTSSSFSSDDSVDSDFEDDFDVSKPKTDTSAIEARNGKDIQGIPWERLNFTREKYRESRLRQYKNYENLSGSREDLAKVFRSAKKWRKARTSMIFNSTPDLSNQRLCIFRLLTIATSCMNNYLEDLFLEGAILLLFTRMLGCRFLMPSYANGSIGLRNLLWATSKHDVYLMQNYSVMHWSSLLKTGKEVLNVAKPIVPTLKYPGCLAQPLSRVQISTMTVKDSLLVAGGFQGELICKHLDKPGVTFSMKISSEENAITNAVDIFNNPSGAPRVITANNDAQVRVMDAVNFTCLNRFMFPWSVNNTSVSPDAKMFSVLGDSAECLLADVQSGKVIGNLKGHQDYSFSSAWHPDGRILATGNQDTTCRLWDVRNLSESMAVLKGRMGAIRTLRFTSDGRFMAMAEPADFVHVFDTQSDYSKVQEIDLFGEIAGISFSPDTEALFVGVSDRIYGSLLEFNRRRYDHYLDCIF